MFSSLKRLFFASQRPAPPPARPRPTSVHEKPGAALPDAPGISLSPAQIDAAFYGLVLGVNSMLDREPNGFETRALRDLDRLLAADVTHSDLVPRLPAVIPRVMTALRDEDSSAADLAAELGRDAVLVSEVLRLSNSALYRAGKEITSLERAVFTLGRTGIRQLVANAALKPLLNPKSGHFSQLSGTLLWEQSEKAAVACDYLAKAEHVDRFHAYLTAIVQNVGFAVALQVLDRRFDGSEAPHSQRFREQWVKRSRRLAVLIADEWEFPPAVLDVLKGRSEERQPNQESMLDTVVHTGDLLAKAHLLSRRGRIDCKPTPAIELPAPRLARHIARCCERLED